MCSQAISPAARRICAGSPSARDGEEIPVSVFQIGLLLNPFSSSIFRTFNISRIVSVPTSPV